MCSCLWNSLMAARRTVVSGRMPFMSRLTPQLPLAGSPLIESVLHCDFHYMVCMNLSDGENIFGRQPKKATLHHFNCTSLTAFLLQLEWDSGENLINGRPWQLLLGLFLFLIIIFRNDMRTEWFWEEGVVIKCNASSAWLKKKHCGGAIRWSPII